MKNILLIGIMLILGCENPKSSDEYISGADEKIQNKNFIKAIYYLNKALEIDNKRIDALIKRGYCKAMIQDNIGAINDYTNVVKIDNKNVLAYYNLALNKSTIKDYNGALKDINRAISCKGNEFIWIDKKYNESVDNNYEYDIAMVELRMLRGELLFEFKRYKEAYLDYNFCIDQKFNLPESYYWSGVSLLNLGHKKEACEDLEKSKKLGDIYADEVICNYCK